MEVKKVMRMIEARDAGQERFLRGEVDDVGIEALDHTIRGRNHGPSLSAKQRYQPGRGARDFLPQACGARELHRVEPAPSPDVGAQPVLRVGVGEEDVLLLSIAQVRQPAGQSDDDLLDASSPPPPRAGVDDDTERFVQQTSPAS
jgi:hypothetical protein